MGFCLLQWVFLAAIRTSFSGLNISVHLRETQMVYPNPRFWESKTLQLTQPRALGRAFKMQTSFAPLLCCLPHYFVAKTPLISYPWKHMGDLMQGTSVTISFPGSFLSDGRKMATDAGNFSEGQWQSCSPGQRQPCLYCFSQEEWLSSSKRLLSLAPRSSLGLAL